MASLFSPYTLNRLEVSNRVVISPMCQYSAENGQITEWHQSHYLQMACSGAGMFFIEATAISPDGRITSSDLGLYNKAQCDLLAKLVVSCKKFSQSKIALQISHAGRKGSTSKPHLGGSNIHKNQGGWDIYSSSPISRGEGYACPIELSILDLDIIANNFAMSATLANEACIDCLEVHMAHGYLLHQFLSPISNRRNDQYGAGQSGRFLFPLEVMRRVRNAWGWEKPLGVRITATDWLEGGITLDDAIALVSILKSQVAIDFATVTSGGIIPRTNLVAGEQFQVPFAEKINQACDVSVIAVGQISNPISANQIIKNNSANFIAIARPYLADPRWVWDAAKKLDAKIEVPYQYLRGY
jgi:2,4-dienoyl-CoA reductase-like NADH-dependent reductase (Old Yellow Enzyme family)